MIQITSMQKYLRKLTILTSCFMLSLIKLISLTSDNRVAQRGQVKLTASQPALAQLQHNKTNKERAQLR